VQEGYILLAIFSPQYIVCERTVIAWPKGEKIKTLGEKISYFPLVGFLCSFSVTIKIIGEKILLCPLLPAFFLSFP
jgi:hypothetical protein